MKTQSTKAATKQVKSNEAHRIVVRGHIGKKYVRRVKVVRGTYDEAQKFANDNINVLAKGIKDVFVNVFNGAKGSGYVEHK